MTKRILVIEDRQKEAKPIMQLLVFSGYTVIHAYNGVDGLALAAAEHPDLVLVDLLLVERGDSLTGYEVIERLRAVPATAQVGIIAWTSQLVEEKDAILALRIGADDYITKESAFGVLEARIEALLRRTSRT